MNKDLSPIDQKWISNYCDLLINIAKQMPTDSILRVATERRIECVMDLVEAWQNRNNPLEARDGQKQDS